jgi:hypothetical protein
LSDRTKNFARAKPPKPGDEDVVDRREQFERSANAASVDADAERAFLMSKVELIRNDLNLSDEEKERAIAELEGRIRELADSGNPLSSE